MANRLTRTPERDEIFFEYFAKTANVTAACALSGYNDSSVYEWRKKFPDFEEKWIEAEKLATAQLEAEMYRRAVFGVHRSDPIMWQGKIVATKEIDEYSDTLAIFLAKARDPEKYRERVEITINWRAELKQFNIDPEALLAQQTEMIRKQLESASEVIDVEPIKRSIKDRSEIE